MSNKELKHRATIANKSEILDDPKKIGESIIRDINVNLGNVDIIRDYPWTLNKLPDIIRNEVPYIELVEYRQSISQFLNSLLYQAGTTVESFNSIVGDDTLINSLKGAFNELLPGGNSLSSVKFTVPEKSEKTDTIVKKLADSLGLDTKSNSVFGNMYVGDPTNNIYRFPFITNEAYIQYARTTWGDSSGSTVTDFLKDLGSSASEALMAPGKIFGTNTFTETVKMYQPNVEGNYIKLQFTLYNTVSSDKVLQNYRFVTNFVKVNKHIRTSRVNVLPPVYYTMNIPSVRYSPACYVAALNVHNEGKLRLYKFQGNEIMVPDAYNITIELQDLVSDCSNLIGQLDENQMNQVRVIQDKQDFIKGIDR